VVDDRQRIIGWNRGAERLLGYAAAEVLHRSCHEVIAGCGPNGQAVCGSDCSVHRSVERAELPRSIGIQARTKAGRPIWLHLSVIVVPRGTERLKVHVLHDASDERHATEFMAQVASMVHVDDAARQSDGAHVLRPGAGEGSSGSLPGVDTLTTRERHVLRLVAEGLSNRAIALQLQVSAYTVRNHVQHILTKSGARNRAEAVSLALRIRLP
jgi:PAS domain S-box-containing protein